GVSEFDTKELHGTGVAWPGGVGLLRTGVSLRARLDNRRLSRCSIRSIRRRRSILNLLLGIKQLENALGGGHPRLQLVHHPRNLCERLIELTGVLNKRGYRPQGHLSGCHPKATYHRDTHVA